MLHAKISNIKYKMNKLINELLYHLLALTSSCSQRPKIYKADTHRNYVTNSFIYCKRSCLKCNHVSCYA